MKSQKARRPAVAKSTPKCRERILACLKFAAKHPQQIADELFLSRITVRVHLAALLKGNGVFRKFFHNTKTNKPDYLYSSVKFPAYGVELTLQEARRAARLNGLLGDWDSATPTQTDDHAKPAKKPRREKQRWLPPQFAELARLEGEGGK